MDQLKLIRHVVGNNFWECLPNADLFTQGQNFCRVEWLRILRSEICRSHKRLRTYCYCYWKNWITLFVNLYALVLNFFSIFFLNVGSAHLFRAASRHFRRLLSINLLHPVAGWIFLPTSAYSYSMQFRLSLHPRLRSCLYSRYTLLGPCWSCLARDWHLSVPRIRADCHRKLLYEVPPNEGSTGPSPL